MTTSGAPCPKLYAHRGSTLLAPENTASAFDLAVDYQADVLETDVRLSRDGQVLVTHDERVDRTTDGYGAVRDFKLTQLKTLDAAYRFMGLQGEQYRGRKIRLMTLDELLEKYPTMGINIDIKDADQNAVEAVAAAIRRHPNEQRVNVGSFHANTLRHFRRVAPEISTAAVFSEVAGLYFERLLDWLPAARKSGPRLPFTCLQIPMTYRGIPLATRQFIRNSQARGLTMIYWTINDVNRMQKLLNLGIDGLVTDRPDLAQAVFHTLGYKPRN